MLESFVFSTTPKVQLLYYCFIARHITVISNFVSALAYGHAVYKPDKLKHKPTYMLPYRLEGEQSKVWPFNSWKGKEAREGKLAFERL